jgi:peptide/nickel transport system substrate-binding protein
MLRTRRAAGLTAAAAVAGLVLAACGSSSSGNGGGNSSSPSPSTSTSTSTSPPPSSNVGFQKLSTNAGGTPVSGGTLNVIGNGDVDYLDPNLTYYTVGYMAAREYSRQLYTYPAVIGQTTNVVPDLATAPPVVTNGGKTLTVTIKQGADWDTTPARQVSAADEIRGVEITCNPSTPFGGTPDFSALIVGYQKFCAGFAKAPATVAGIKSYITAHPLKGVTVGSTPETVVFHLTQPATYFGSELALPALSPRPVEMLKYLPGSAAEAQHTISDGPYKIQSYSPTHSIVFVRNPAWKASTDSVRHAYVNEIKITEGEQQTSIEQQLLTGSADLPWDLGPTATQANTLINQDNPLINVQSEISSNPYIIFNTVSPNNGGALNKVAVRQALSYAIQRSDLIQDAGGPKLAPALTHVLPPQIDGSPANASYYAYNPTKAKQLLASAGVKNLTLKFLYRPSSATSTAMFQDIQNQLQKIGVKVTGVTASPEDFYVKYLEKPSAARSGAWDISLAGWGPDWYGNAALSFFTPLFDGKILPPLSSNFGLFNDPKVNALINTASTATSLTASNADWAAADNKVMEDAAIYPIEDPNGALIHAAQVHNDVYVPALQNFDFTNVWLSSS